MDECGATPFFTGGGRLSFVEGDQGKMTANALSKVILHKRQDVRWGPDLAVTVTETTEFGTVYTPEELRGISVADSGHYKKDFSR